MTLGMELRPREDFAAGRGGVSGGWLKHSPPAGLCLSHPRLIHSCRTEIFQKCLCHREVQNLQEAAAILQAARSHGCPLKGTPAGRWPAEAKEPGRLADILLSSALNLEVPFRPVGGGGKRKWKRGRRSVGLFRVLFLLWDGDSPSWPWEGQLLRPD